MDHKDKYTKDRMIFFAQVVSVSLIWIFVTGIGVWIVNLLLLSLDLHDVPGATVGISMIAIPVFVTLASVLTYVFVGLHREERSFKQQTDGKTKEG